jgi:hypothetical protein
VPSSLVEQVTGNRVQLKEGFKLQLSDEQMVARVRRMAEEEKVELRLLTDLRMEKIWSLFTSKNFQNQDSLKCMTFFISELLVARMDAQERSLEESQKAKLKQLKRTLEKQVTNLIQTIREVDEWSCGPESMKLVKKDILDGPQSYENQLLRLQESLLQDINSYNASTSPKVVFTMSPEEKASLMNIKKRGSGDYAERFIATVAAIFFKRWFGKSYSARAYDAAMVVLGKHPEHYIVKEHKRDRVRKNSNRTRKIK